MPEWTLLRIDHELVVCLDSLVEDDVLSFSELQEELDKGNAIEATIYVSLLLFQVTRSAEHLCDVIQRTELWISAVSLDNADRRRRQEVLDMLNARKCRLEDRDNDELVKKFGTAMAPDDLDQTIWGASMLIESLSANDPRLADHSSVLGIWYFIRFERSGSSDDLREGVRYVNKAVQNRPDQHPDREAYLGAFNIWYDRFKRKRSTGNLDGAIDCIRTAVNATPTDHAARPFYLTMLSLSLHDRFLETERANDLHQAVQAVNEAVALTPLDHPDLRCRFSLLGKWLELFNKTRSLKDLDRAIQYVTMAVTITPEGHPALSSYLGTLGSWNHERYERTGFPADLDSAIRMSIRSLDATPQNHQNRARRLVCLGSYLGKRFEDAHSLADLNHAIEVTETAMEISPEDDPDDLATLLVNKGIWLANRFSRTALIRDMDQAIEAMDTATGVISQDHPRRYLPFHNLGRFLGKRYEKTESQDDLTRAINALATALEYVPKTSPDRAGVLCSYGHWLRKRRSADDIDRSVDMVDMAVQITSQDDPKRAAFLDTLGRCLVDRFTQKHSNEDLDRRFKEDSPEERSKDDLNRAIACLTEGWHCRNARPSIRIQLAKDLGNIYWIVYNFEKATEWFRRAIELLPTVSSRVLKHADQEHLLGNIAGLASKAAATALEAGEDATHALQLLDLGRGVIAGELMDMREDISDLQHQHPDLAQEFVALRDELDSAIDTTAIIPSTDSMLSRETMTTATTTSAAKTRSWEEQAERRREANQRFDDLIRRIRAQDEFENFLLPPSADDLMASAEAGPVIVVNVSNARSDAFLITRLSISVLPLPSMTPDEVQTQAQHLVSSPYDPSPVLEWLWDAVARPCLEALGFTNPVTDDNWPHVWWIPTGMVTQLPLHAAGRYTPGSKETVLDRVMSSYALSVKSLLFARRCLRKSAVLQSNYGLLVAMRQTPGLARNCELPFVSSEEALFHSACTRLDLQPSEPKACKEDVLRAIQTCKVFHFAGHGESNPAAPLRSQLLLEDWQTAPLTVGDLLLHSLHHSRPFLGFLSACSTGSTRAEKLVDEGIHLVSALQLAGFRHVVGTLWEVSDRYCVDVAEVLYATLAGEGMSDGAVCRGLHLAVRMLRDGGKMGDGVGVRKGFLVEDGPEGKARGNWYWIPYVHFGV